MARSLTRAMRASQEAPVGSQWYVWGHHYEVTGHVERDGEPALRLRRLSGNATGPKRPRPQTVIARLFLRRAARTNSSAATTLTAGTPSSAISGTH